MLGERIADLRRREGLSQAELADILGVSPSTVGMYEQSRREPALNMLVKLAQTFHVTTDYLLTGTVSPPGSDLESLCSRILESRQRRIKPVLSQEELTMLVAAMLMEG